MSEITILTKLTTIFEKEVIMTITTISHLHSESSKYYAFNSATQMENGTLELSGIGKINSRAVRQLGIVLKEKNYFQPQAEHLLKFKFGDLQTPFVPTFFFPLFRIRLNNEKNPLGLLLLFFYCGYPVQQRMITSILGKQLVTEFCKAGFFEVLKGHKVKSKIQIIPFLQLCVATEPPLVTKSHIYSLSFGNDSVINLLPDSYDLANKLNGQCSQDAIDLCCGNGVQSLVLAQNAKKVLGVDINIKALQYASFNAILNGFDNIKFEYCDVTQPINNLGRFDFIAASLPFCPVSPQQKIDSSIKVKCGNYFLEILLKKRIKEIAKQNAKAEILFTLALKSNESVVSKIQSYTSNDLKYKNILINFQNNAFGMSSLDTFLIYSVAFRNIIDLTKYNKELEKYYKLLKQIGIKEITNHIMTIVNIVHKP